MKKRELPKGWRWVKINDALESIQIFNPAKYAGASFGYIDISSVDSITKKITSSNEIAIKEAPSRAKYVLKENDILVSTVRPNLNAVAVVGAEYDGCIGSSGFCVLRLRKDYSPLFFFNFLISPYFVSKVSELVQGAMYPAISNNDVKGFHIPVPPTLDEQIAIANGLERKMKEIADMRQATVRQKEAIEAMPGAVLREVFDFEM